MSVSQSLIFSSNKFVKDVSLSLNREVRQWDTRERRETMLDGGVCSVDLRSELEDAGGWGDARLGGEVVGLVLTEYLEVEDERRIVVKLDLLT